MLSGLAITTTTASRSTPRQKPRLIADIDDKTFLMLRNHGLLVAGSSVQEAFLAAYTFEAACAIQIKAQSGGSELIPIARPILDGIAAQARVVLVRMGRELAWPTLLRRLDRTDPPYRS